METIEMTNQEIMEAWSALFNLLKNAEIPNFRARYAIARAYDKMVPAVKPLLIEDDRMMKKYFRKVNGGKADELKEGKNIEDFNKERDEFLNEKTEVEIYKIKKSTLHDIKLLPEEDGDNEKLFIYMKALKNHIMEE